MTPVTPVEPVTLITTFRCCPVIEQFIGGDRGGKVIKVGLFKTGYITLCYCWLGMPERAIVSPAVQNPKTLTGGHSYFNAHA